MNVSAFNYTGLSSATLYENLFPSYGYDYTADGQRVDFASVFGVLFTGVTGVMAGANMSGETSLLPSVHPFTLDMRDSYSLYAVVPHLSLRLGVVVSVQPHLVTERMCTQAS